MWFFALMYFRNGCLKSRVLSECLLAIINSAPEQLAPFMCFYVPPQSCSCQEALGAMLPGADMISLVRVGGLDMVLEMRISKESFCARRIRTNEGSVIVVGAKMLLKLGRTIESFAAAVNSTSMYFVDI